MKKTLRIKLFAIIALAAFGFGISNAQIRITEVMSHSAPKDGGGTGDWFELTNFGTTGIDITGWKMDDDTFVDSLAVALNGITTIKSGESVIFLDVTDGAPTDTVAFKTFWGSSLDSIQVGYYGGSGVGFGKGGDGVIVFDAEGTEVTRVSFGEATTGSSFYWTYDISLNVVDNGVVSTVGVKDGNIADQVTITSDNAVSNIGSPGTAYINDLFTSNPTNLADDIKSWNLIGKSLQFKQVPAQAIEIYSLTGSKVATHAPASLIELDLNQGIYILKIDGKAHKVIIR